MKIVKSFSDLNFYYRMYPFNKDDLRDLHPSWRWGLGKDGQLYCQCSFFNDPYKWHDWETVVGFKMSINEMKRIVKEFGNLLPFL